MSSERPTVNGEREKRSFPIADRGSPVEELWGRIVGSASRFAVHALQLTLHDSRFTVHDSQFTIHGVPQFLLRNRTEWVIMHTDGVLPAERAGNRYAYTDKKPTRGYGA